MASLAPYGGPVVVGDLKVIVPPVTTVKTVHLCAYYEANDSVYRLTAEWQVNDDVMAYATWGEGYRPGGLNRFCATRLQDGLGNQGASNIGCEFLPDFLTAQEIGFKASLLDGKLRLNAAAFWQEWDDFQFSRLDTSISPITLTYNVGNAEVMVSNSTSLQC